MSIQLSQRIQKVKPSATLTMAAKAEEMKIAGKDIISLSVGEPDFDTPAHIKAAAKQAMDAGLTKYTAVSGTLGLREAIVQKFKRENQLTYKASQILVSNGAKQSIYNLMQALLNPGDEVIIPAPYWVSYPDMTLLSEAVPVFISADIRQKFKITPEQLNKAISPKTRLVIINSPSNPTGMVYSKSELTALAKILLKHPQIYILSDDIYEHILWTHEPYANIVNACPELYDRTIIVNGVSKAYSMTGWRIGYAAGPEPLIKAMANVQSQSTSNACSISQKAAEAALKESQACITEMVHAFKQRHDAAIKLLNTLPGFECIATDGAFYLFPRVQKAIDKLGSIKDDITFAEYLLMEAGVAVVPGTAFGMPGYIRLSIATSEETFTRAANKIKAVL